MLSQSMLGNSSTALLSSDLGGARGQEKSSVRTLINPLLSFVDSDQWEISGEQDPGKLSFIKSQLLSLSTELRPERLSEDLLRLGKSLLNDPSFVTLGEAILHRLVASQLKDGPAAQQALLLHQGLAGSIGEQLRHTVRRLAHAENLAPMVVGMAGAGLVGRGFKLLGTHWFRGTRFMTKLGEWAVHTSASMTGLLSEAAVFPGMHAGGALLVNQPIHLENYLGQAYQGLILMGSLRVAGAAARLTRQVIHGMPLAKTGHGLAWPVVTRLPTRLKSLTSLSQWSLPAAYELGALMLLNKKDSPALSLAAHFSRALETFMEFRLAGGLLNSLAPQITLANRVLEERAAYLLREVGGQANKKVAKYLGGPSRGPGGMPGLKVLAEAMAGMGSVSLDQSALKGAEFLHARYDRKGVAGIGGPHGPQEFRVSPVVRDKVYIPDTYFQDLQTEMSSGWSLDRTPLLESHWQEFHDLVNRAVGESRTGHLDPHARLYGLIDILYRDLLARFEQEGLGVPAYKPHGTFAEDLAASHYPPQFEGNQRKWEAFGKVRWTSLKINRHTPSEVSFVDVEEIGLRQHADMLNHELTLGGPLHQPISFHSRSILGPSEKSIRFPHPVDLIEYLFNHAVAPGLRQGSSEYPRADLRYWVDFKAAEPTLAMERMGTGRALLISPFYADAMHFIAKDVDQTVRKSGFRLLKFNIKPYHSHAHPTDGLYHDLYHGLSHALFSEGVVTDNLQLRTMVLNIAPQLNSPELIRDIDINLYDFGFENKAYRREEDFYCSYRIFFDFVVRLARTHGKAQVFRELFRKEMANYFLPLKGPDRYRFRMVYKAFEQAIINDRIQHEAGFSCYPNMTGPVVFN